jgi:hypothetical protein
MRRVALVVVLALLPVSAATARTVTVPRDTGPLPTVYQRLHAAGLVVTITKPFVSDSVRPRDVKSETPRPGRRVAAGSAVSLAVKCCARAVGHHGRAATPPRLVGRSAGAAAAWASGHSVRLIAHLGRLSAGHAATLLGNFRVTRQSPAGGHRVRAGQALAIWADQPPPAPAPPRVCRVPAKATLLASDDQAFVWSVEGSGSVVYEGCVRPTGATRRLIETSTPGVTGHRTASAIAGDIVALAFRSSNKYVDCIDEVDVYDLASGATLPGFQNYLCADTGLLDGGIDSLAVDTLGHAAWRLLTTPVNVREITGVTCPSAAACFAVDSHGDLVTGPAGDPTTWTASAIDPGGSLSAIACGSPSLCVTTNGTQLLTSTNPTDPASWTTGSVTGVEVGFGTVTALSCPSASLCVALDGAGEVLASTNPAGGAHTWRVVSQQGPAPSALSCPSTTECVAANGDVLVSQNPSAGKGAWKDIRIAGLAPDAVSCPSTSLCVATDMKGGIAVSSDPAGGAAQWKTSHLAFPKPLDEPASLTCASPTLCLIGDYEGDVLTSTDPGAGAGSWHSADVDPSTVDLPRRVGAVACAATGGCVAGDSVGDILGAADPLGAWSRAAVDLPPGCVAAPCITEELEVSGLQHAQVLDTSTPGAGTSLQGIGLDSGVLSWTHDGVPHQANLG